MNTKLTLLSFILTMVFFSLQAQSELMKNNTSGTMMGYVRNFETQYTRNQLHGITFGYSSNRAFDFSLAIGRQLGRYPYGLNVGFTAFKERMISLKINVGYTKNTGHNIFDGFNLGLRLFTKPSKGPISFVPFLGVIHFTEDERLYPEAGLFIFGTGDLGLFGGVSLVRQKKATSTSITAGFKFSI